MPAMVHGECSCRWPLGCVTDQRSGRAANPSKPRKVPDLGVGEPAHLRLCRLRAAPYGRPDRRLGLRFHRVDDTPAVIFG
jgi:hypothetical protein